MERIIKFIEKLGKDDNLKYQNNQGHEIISLHILILFFLIYMFSPFLQLALKHRQGKNHKMRIVVFIGSPVNLESKEMTKLAKRLKKEKVNVDIVSFGEEVK